MNNTFDTIVVGVGGWGGATLFHLAKRGAKVCGIDQFSIGHDRGSSHGESRVIRMAYFMHPSYVPLLRRAYALWRELEKESGKSLMALNGLVCIGEAQSAFVKGLERCYATHEIPHERLTPAEAMKRAPQFQIPEDSECYWDPFGGYLRADECTMAHVELAARAGATLIQRESVVAIEHHAKGVTVRTNKRTLRAGKVVVTSGAFTSQLLRISGYSLVQALRKMIFWYRVNDPALFSPERFPVWIAKLGGYNFYGFPSSDGATIKAAEDSGGQILENAHILNPDPEPEDEAQLRPFLDQLFPGKILGRERWKTCLYENTPDRNFIIDHHPDLPNVIIAAGGSGHGFKFSTVVGEIVADMATSRATRLPTDLFRLARLVPALAS